MNIATCNPHGFANCPLCEPDPPKGCLVDHPVFAVPCERCKINDCQTSGPLCVECLDAPMRKEEYREIRSDDTLTERERCAKVCKALSDKVPEADSFGVIKSTLKMAAQKIREGK